MFKTALILAGGTTGVECFDLMQFLSLNNVNAKIIGPNIRTFADILFIPDTGGLNLSVPAIYKNGFDLPPVMKGQDQWIEHWRVMTMNYYINKKIPIVAFGTSALMMFAEMGGLLDYIHEVEPLRDDSKAHFFYGQSPRWDFLMKNVLGIKDMVLDEELLAMIHKNLTSNSSTGQKMMEPSPTPLPPMSRDNKKEIPKDESDDLFLPPEDDAPIRKM